MSGPRIASLLPSATEVVCALGLRENLVAVSHECDYPPGVDGLPHATVSRLDPKGTGLRDIDDAVRAAQATGAELYGIRTDVLERSEADVIVTQGLCDVCAVSGETVASSLACELRGPVVDARVAALAGGDFAGICEDIMTVARLLDVVDRADELIEGMRSRWASLCELTVLEPCPSVLVLEWTEPPFSGGHWIPEMVAQAGAKHVLGDPGEKSQTLTWKQVAAADPDVLVVANCGFGLSQNEHHARRLLDRNETRKLRAVRERRLWAVDANAHFSRPGPRIVDGAEILAKILHGQACDPMREARKI